MPEDVLIQAARPVRSLVRMLFLDRFDRKHETLDGTDGKTVNEFAFDVDERNGGFFGGHVQLRVT